MKKIPLESTIVGSYKFLFTNIVSIIGTLWLPVLLFVAVLGALVWSIVPHAWFHCDFTPIADPEGYVRAHLPAIALAVPCLLVAALLTGAMIRVGILRHALGEKTKTTWIWFSLGARVWRMVAAGLLYLVIYLGLQIAVRLAIAAVVLVLALIPGLPHVAIGLITACAAVAGIAFGIYVIARLFFFLPAVVVAENSVGVARAWELGRGNVWRIILVVLAVVVPVMIIGGIVVGVTALTTILAFVATHHEPKTAQDVIALVKSLLPALLVIGGVYLVMVVASLGLVLGAIGKAYKAVTAPDEAAG